MVWDKQELLARLMNNEEIIPVLLSAFIEDAPRTLNELKDAVAQNNIELITRQAHTLKGMSANLAANPLAEISRQIELASKGESDQALEPLIEELEKSFNDVMDCFKEELSA